MRRDEPIRFTRGRHLYQIALNYRGGEGYVGLRDGRLVVQGDSKASVARALVSGIAAPPAPLSDDCYTRRTTSSVTTIL